MIFSTYATQPLPRAERATIPHMKEEMQGFHMNQISEIFFGEKALFSALSQSKSAAPRMFTFILLVSNMSPSSSSNKIFALKVGKTACTWD